MNEVKHTPEPWKHDPGTETIRSQKENYWIASMNSWDGAVDNTSNAERIVSCVNACAGLTPEQVQRLPEIINEGTVAIDECQRLRFQRDELLEALEIAKKQILKTGVNYDNAESYNTINSAIEKGKGGK